MDISLITRIFPRPPTQLAKFPHVSYAKPSKKVCIILGLLIACHQLVPRVLSYSSPGWRDDPENEDSLFRDQPLFFFWGGGGGGGGGGGWKIFQCIHFFANVSPSFWKLFFLLNGLLLAYNLFQCLQHLQTIYFRFFQLTLNAWRCY